MTKILRASKSVTPETGLDPCTHHSHESLCAKGSSDTKGVVSEVTDHVTTTKEVSRSPNTIEGFIGVIKELLRVELGRNPNRPKETPVSLKGSLVTLKVGK